MKNKNRPALPYELCQSIFRTGRYGKFYKYYDGRKNEKKILKKKGENIHLFREENIFRLATKKHVFRVENRKTFDISEIKNIGCKVLYLHKINKITNKHGVRHKFRKLVLTSCSLIFAKKVFKRLHIEKFKVRNSVFGGETFVLKRVKHVRFKNNNFFKHYTEAFLEANIFRLKSLKIDERVYTLAVKPGRVFLRRFALPPMIIQNVRILYLKNVHYDLEDLFYILKENKHLKKLVLMSNYEYKEIYCILRECVEIQYLSLHCRNKKNLGCLIAGLYKIRSTLQILQLKINNFDCRILKTTLRPFLSNCKLKLIKK